MCYHVEFRRSRSSTRNPKICERWWGQAPWDGAWLTHKKHAPSPHVLPCRTSSLCVKRYRRYRHKYRNPKNWGAVGPAPWDGDVADPQKYAFPTCYHAEFVRFRWNSTSVTSQTPEKNDLLRPPFKVIQGHRNRHGSIGFLWLPVNIA